MASKPKEPQFSPEEKASLMDSGRGLAGNPTPFDTDVQHHLQRFQEANAAKMKAAASGGSDLGPTQMERQAVKQQDAMMAQQTSQGAQQAQTAQAQQMPQQPPPAPSCPLGVSTPYPAQQRGSAAATGPAAGMPAPAPSASPAAPGIDEESEEEEPQEQEEQ